MQTQFVTGISAAPLYQMRAKILFRSLIKYGGIQEDQIHLIALGNNERETKEVRRELFSEFRKIHYIEAPFNHKQFQIFKPWIDRGLIMPMTDYLRALIGNRLNRYVWMDSDMIATRRLGALSRIAQGTTRIQMASDRKIRGYNPILSQYGYLYLRCFNDFPKVKLSDAGFYFTMNAGLIVVDKNYALEWKEIFLHLAKKAERDRKLRQALVHPLAGQGIWNLIFWKNGGKVLDSRYNSIPPNYLARYKKNPVFPGDILHYTLQDRSVILRAARKLKLLAVPPANRKS